VPSFDVLHPRAKKGTKNAGQFIDVIGHLTGMGGRYDPEAGTWHVPTEKRSELKTLLADAGYDVQNVPPGMKAVNPMELTDVPTVQRAGVGQPRDLQQIVREMGALDMDTSSTDRPDLFMTHPRSGFTVRDPSKPAPKITTKTPANYGEGEFPMVADFVPGPAGLGDKQVTPERPLPFVFRAVHEDEYQEALERGFMQSDQRMNLSQAEGTVAAVVDPTFYLPGKLASDENGDYPGRLVKIALDPEHGWHYDRDGYVKTSQPIPIKQIVDVSPPIITERRTRPSGNPETNVRVLDTPAPLTKGTTKFPPAWTDVFVAESPDNDLQVVGRDSKGREQRIYSDAFRATKDREKFARIQHLQNELPKIDAALDSDAGHDPAAAAVLLVRMMGLRPGSDRDTLGSAKAFGASNLERRHVHVTGDTVKLDFVGKGGKHIKLEKTDHRLARMFEHYTRGKSGDQRIFDTNEVKMRAWLADHAEGLKVKDFRTRIATSTALQLMSDMPSPTTPAEFQKARNNIGDQVAAMLGNTRTMALTSYIDPTVFKRWQEKL
jgi:DNA topoisomerase-1